MLSRTQYSSETCTDTGSTTVAYDSVCRLNNGVNDYDFDDYGDDFISRSEYKSAWCTTAPTAGLTFLNLYSYNGSVDSSTDCVDSNLSSYHAYAIGVCIQQYSWNDTEPTLLLSYEYSYVNSTDGTNITLTYTEYSSFDCTGDVLSDGYVVIPTTCK